MTTNEKMATESDSYWLAIGRPPLLRCVVALILVLSGCNLIARFDFDALPDGRPVDADSDSDSDMDSDTDTDADTDTDTDSDTDSDSDSDADSDDDGGGGCIVSPTTFSDAEIREAGCLAIETRALYAINIDDPIAIISLDDTCAVDEGAEFVAREASCLLPMGVDDTLCIIIVDSVDIAATYRLGIEAPHPVALYSLGLVDIQGIIDVSGTNTGAGPGGGAAGASGIAGGGHGLPGVGSYGDPGNGGGGSRDAVCGGGGGGGGNLGVGGQGGCPSTGGFGAVAVGTCTLDDLARGSGGGGGNNLGSSAEFVGEIVMF